MNIVYKNWESGQGLEEIQANIYTELLGLPARSDEISPRNDGRGTDMTKYVLTDDGKPLAYPHQANLAVLHVDTILDIHGGYQSVQRKRK